MLLTDTVCSLGERCFFRGRRRRQTKTRPVYPRALPKTRIGSNSRSLQTACLQTKLEKIRESFGWTIREEGQTPNKALGFW